MVLSFDDVRREATDRWNAVRTGPHPRILVGTATCGRSAGSLDVLDAFREEAKNRSIECHVIEVGCVGLCYAEPIVTIEKASQPGVVYGDVTVQRARQLVEAYLAGDDPLGDFALGTLGQGTIDGIPRLFDRPVFKSQLRRTLRNCGVIDPTKIDDYIAHGGYSGLASALEMGPERIIEEVKKAGLRGRGGAGFPAWRKWQFARDADDPDKYIVCNGSEGDPGAFSNKLLFESDPHSVLEGILIAAYAVGAGHGYVYCPSDYPLALERLQQAVEQMEQAGLLGEAVLGSSWSFRLKIKAGAGAYVCGEETALIECIEGDRGSPRCRPPFPPVAGAWNHPTIVNNVETLACVTQVLQDGASAFAAAGTAQSPGTKTICLSGNVKRPGTIEVPFGTALREIVWGMGGGTADGEPVKAVYAGGPGGGYLPARLDQLPLDQASFVQHGAAVGSGGMVIIGRESCMVDLARNSLEFACAECCGQCTPCRLGTRQLLDIVADVAEGRGRREDIDLLEELAEGIRLGSLCGLGQAAANPMLSTIRYFRDEYEAHVETGACPAGVCRSAVPAPV